MKSLMKGGGASTMWGVGNGILHTSKFLALTEEKVSTCKLKNVCSAPSELKSEILPQGHHVLSLCLISPKIKKYSSV